MFKRAMAIPSSISSVRHSLEQLAGPMVHTNLVFGPCASPTAAATLIPALTGETALLGNDMRGLGEARPDDPDANGPVASLSAAMLLGLMRELTGEEGD